MANPPDIFDDIDDVDAGFGLCLSGGGYRAMLFHCGSVTRLNEAGVLPKLTRISAVSGGSVTAAKLGLHWSELEFSDGVAKRLKQLVVDPVIEFAGTTIDTPSVISGVLPGRIAREVAKHYKNELFGPATLQALPADNAGPLIILAATNLGNGSLWRFSRPYMRDWRTPNIATPVVPLHDAVAASSAFPPVLSPFLLELPGTGNTVQLADGGVYDNLGLEPVVKRCRTVLVSDAGRQFDVQATPPKDWVRGTIRVLETVDVQVRRLRRRQIVGLLATEARQGAFWSIGTDVDRYNVPMLLDCPQKSTEKLACVKTRLAKLDIATRHRLVNWGYTVTDAALRAYYDTSLSAASSFPYPHGVG